MVTRRQQRAQLEYLALFEDDVMLPERSAVVSGSAILSAAQPRELSGAILPLPASLETFHADISGCTRCPLGHTRTKFVFADGNPQARIVFVGEAPGHDEDLQGLPFVGRAGQLLNQLLAGVGLSRQDVYICNVLKCRPPNNRDPQPSEVETCRPYLLTQLSLLNPDLLVCLGRHAALALMGIELPMKELRGRVLDWQGIRTLITYHPAYFLRNNSQTYLGEQDFRHLRDLYDALPPR